jgi:hypothetical protein
MVPHCAVPRCDGRHLFAHSDAAHVNCRGPPRHPYGRCQLEHRPGALAQGKVGQESCAFSATNSKVLTGVSVGGGVDVKLGGNWSARGEYRYADYGTWRTTLGTPATLAVTADIRMRTHTALFGLAHTFTGLRQ